MDQRDSEEQLSDRLRLTEALNEHSQDWGPVLVLSPERIPDLTTLHVDIVEAVRESGIDSVGELAASLNHEVGEIKSAVDHLVEIYVLDWDDDSLIIPHETVLIPALTPVEDVTKETSKETSQI